MLDSTQSGVASEGETRWLMFRMATQPVVPNLRADCGAEIPLLKEQRLVRPSKMFFYTAH